MPHRHPHVAHLAWLAVLGGCNGLFLDLTYDSDGGGGGAGTSNIGVSSTISGSSSGTAAGGAGASVSSSASAGGGASSSSGAAVGGRGAGSGRLPCGATTCDEDQICCLGGSGAGQCAPTVESCIGFGIPATCNGPGFCGPDQACCYSLANGLYPAIECVDACVGEAAIMCTDAPSACPMGLACGPFLPGYDACS